MCDTAWHLVTCHTGVHSVFSSISAHLTVTTRWRNTCWWNAWMWMQQTMTAGRPSWRRRSGLRSRASSCWRGAALTLRWRTKATKHCSVSDRKPSGWSTASHVIHHACLQTWWMTWNCGSRSRKSRKRPRTTWTGLNASTRTSGGAAATTYAGTSVTSRYICY